MYIVRLNGDVVRWGYRGEKKVVKKGVFRVFFRYEKLNL